MKPVHCWSLPRFGGIFIGGGEMSWKLDTAPAWIALAHAHGLRCHIGRIGTLARLELARRLGADSSRARHSSWRHRGRFATS